MGSARGRRNPNIGTSVLGCRDATCCNQNQKGTQCFFPSASFRAWTLSLPLNSFSKFSLNSAKCYSFKFFSRDLWSDPVVFARTAFCTFERKTIRKHVRHIENKRRGIQRTEVAARKGIPLLFPSSRPIVKKQRRTA